MWSVPTPSACSAATTSWCAPSCTDFAWIVACEDTRFDTTECTSSPFLKRCSCNTATGASSHPSSSWSTFQGTTSSSKRDTGSSHSTTKGGASPPSSSSGSGWSTPCSPQTRCPVMRAGHTSPRRSVVNLGNKTISVFVRLIAGQQQVTCNHMDVKSKRFW